MEIIDSRNHDAFSVNDHPDSDAQVKSTKTGKRSALHPAVYETLERTSPLNYGTVYQSSKHEGYRFIRLALEDQDAVEELFEREQFDRVVHLAAQAGVRYSIENPWTYIDCNITGTLSILEACRHNPVKHLVYASSSSVYGLNKKMPLSTSDTVDHPIALYAATKKSNELMAHTYSHLYDIPTSGLRFFTVYGPWGRPDMALFIFTKNILEDKPIDVYNYGNMKRDFTYVDDIVEGVIRVMDTPPEQKEKTGVEEDENPISAKKQVSGIVEELNLDPSTSPTAPYHLYNIGNSSPVQLMDFISAIENTIGKEAQKNLMPIQPGDVPATYADTTDLEKTVGYKPNTPILDGVRKFVDWYRGYYGE
ncbi:MAG: NAD-dependent epimerase/dehydratase family protein [Bacteroidales bacterium]|nr:NAD-dependent epimerase/dehydratase family protein [Bacteroidales bacterium]